MLFWLVRITAAVALAASYIWLAALAIVTSRAGRVVLAIRDAESRTRVLGYPVESFKLWLFVFSGIIAGIAGALLTMPRKSGSSTRANLPLSIPLKP